MEKNKHIKWFNLATQFLLPFFTLGGQVAYALKHPEIGIVMNLLAQPFWLYSSWIAFRSAKQMGMLITTVVFTLITLWGVANYWIR
ncbi:hypothetical protein HGB07_05400 [Candidatus Roizmanbacteria bacterium]|nr:hypothetical protein [Candidatus Roizmanbacteria bacterium]